MLAHTSILKINNHDAHNATGLVVVIDVIRAFTTAGFAFAAGAKEILLVKDIEEAFALQKQFPEALLMGEANGYPIPGFHFDNSPTQVMKQDLSGRTLIQRTTCGTLGVVKAVKADRILTGSFAVAEATLQRIEHLTPEKVTFIATNTRDGDEDHALADYLEQKMLQGNVDSKPYLERVKNSGDAKWLLQRPSTVNDLPAVLALDKFPFAMEVFQETHAKVLRPVLPSGKFWR